jgi:hypothetical protein
MCAWWVVWQTGRECFVGFIEVAWISCPKCLWIFLLFKLSSSQNYSAYVRYRYQRLSKDKNILHLVDWVFFKEKQKKALLPFHLSSVDVVPRCLKQTSQDYSTTTFLSVFFLPLLDHQLKGVAWKKSHPSKLTCFLSLKVLSLWVLLCNFINMYIIWKSLWFHKCVCHFWRVFDFINVYVIFEESLIS